MSGIERCVVLAGGTGGAKLAAGLQDLLGAGLSVVANTADDIEIAGVDVSPDPDLVTYWLTGEIDEERGWGIKDDTFTVFDRLRQARDARLVPPLRPRPRDLPVPARSSSGRGWRAHRRTGADRAGARGRRRGAADVRGACPDPGEDRRGVARPAAVPGRGARRRPKSRGSRSTGLPSAAPTPEVLEAISSRRGDRDRAFQPRDLDRAHHLHAGRARGHGRPHALRSWP